MGLKEPQFINILKNASWRIFIDQPNRCVMEQTLQMILEQKVALDSTLKDKVLTVQYVLPRKCTNQGSNKNQNIIGNV